MDTLTIATRICRRIRAEGYIAYFAGGWVRDWMLGRPSSDIDIATDAPLEKILDLFPRTILVGLAFGVVIVQEEGECFEVATFRKDLSYTNGRKPDRIEPSTPEEDAKRRDFTINGMFYDPLDEKIYDFIGGKADLERGILRAIGEPGERFVEDRLRMVRAVRFAAKFGFHIDPTTEQAILDSAATLFPAVAKERIYQELFKMSEAPHFEQALLDLARLGLLEEIFPSLRPLHLSDFKKTISHIPNNIPFIAKLRELLKNKPLQTQLDEFTDLKVSSKEIEWVIYLNKVEEELKNKKISTRAEWARFYAHPFSAVAVILDNQFFPENKTKHIERQEELKIAIDRIKNKKPVVTSSDLMAAGVKPGKEMGELLKKAETLAIDLNLNEPQAVIPLIRRTDA